MSRILTLGILAVLVWPAAAHANTTERWKMYDGQCYRYSVTNYKNGVVLGKRLWSLNERVDWCQTAPGAKVWSGPTVHRSHNVPNGVSGWSWIDWLAKNHHHYTSPSRWVFYARGEFDGILAWPFVERCTPWIKMTIYQDNPTHVHEEAKNSC